MENPASYTIPFKLALAGSLKAYLESSGFTLTSPPYTLFSGKQEGLSITLYQSGKLLVQGKKAKEFIEFYLEPVLLKTLIITPGLKEESPFIPHIGIDESGKGDFFGPLCVAGVYADQAGYDYLKEIQVRDSKSLTDPMIAKLAFKIKERLQHHIIVINPLKYNEIYPKFGNLNSLLGWGHATCIEQLYEASHCKDVLIDQFADERVVINAVKRKGIELKLKQRHRAEEDLVVAAASILARDTFVYRLKLLSDEVGYPLPKGAGTPVLQAAAKIYRAEGEIIFSKIAKTHFKTLDQIKNKY